MGTAQIQGRLWGERVRDYASIVEPLFRPVYERVFEESIVGMGTRLLDVGCGPGLAAQIAAERGARVCGLDSAEASLTIARRRTPEGDFRLGEMELLPWQDSGFDVVTGFNAFQFAAEPLPALREARRVVSLGGYVAVVIWGREIECETFVTTTAVNKLLPPTAAPSGIPLSTPSYMETLLKKVELTLVSSGDVDCPFEFPDLETAVRGLTSAGMMVAASQRLGTATVQQAVEESLTPFRMSGGGYRQRNRFKYFIANV